ncbi:MAG: 30S ribosomal protein S1, partial [Muribaculaceae bacterium]|nr:30S ribosomal protein S1 [Muribaculaceae bacterium]
EFNKDSKRIILSLSRIAEDATRAAQRAERQANRAERAERNARRQEEERVEAPAIEKTTLGDLGALQALKEQLAKAEKN